jgi:hypothetical protein
MVDEELTNLFNITLKDNASDWCNNFMQHNPNCRFAYLKQIFYRHYQTMWNDEHVYLQQKNLKHESVKRIEMYYERLLKLANSLQTPTTNKFLTVLF